ncbi:MAG: hypothetical protein U0229_11600 [Anaeromyxobacter sp.]
MRTTTSWALLALLVPALTLPAAAAAQAKAAPAAPKKTRVAVLELKAIGVEASKAELLSEIALSEAAALPYLEVIGKSDITSMLGFEKQKKMLGCEEDSACIAEIGGALGVKLVLVGSVGKIGALYRVDLKVLDTAKAGNVRRQGTNVEGAEEKMVPAIQRAVRLLFAPEAQAAGMPVNATLDELSGGAVQQPENVLAPTGPKLRKWIFGVRLALARPNGSIDGTAKMADWVKPHGAFGLDLFYKVTPHLSWGGSLSYGAGSAGPVLKQVCLVDTGAGTVQLTCDPAVIRLALDLNYDFTDQEAKLVPWLNAGVGFESLIVTINGSSNNSISASGFEPFHGGAGLDLRAGKLRFGPYVLLSVAKYSTLEVKVNGNTQSGSINDTKTHSLLFLGLRGAAEF